MKIIKIVLINLLLVTLTYAKIRVDDSSKALEKQPTLHLLTVSLDDYKDLRLNLLYCNSDAYFIEKSFKEYGKKVFKSVFTYSLKDNQVTKENFRLTVKKIAKNISKDDVFIIYMAGHGTAYRDKFYFMSYGSGVKNFRKNAIDEKTFIDAFSLLPTTNALLLIDSSNSGRLVQNISDRVGIDMISSTKANQHAVDGYKKKHSPFTYLILEAMKSKKVHGVDSRLSVAELSEYIHYFLPKLTLKEFGRKQNPMVFLKGMPFVIGGR